MIKVYLTNLIPDQRIKFVGNTDDISIEVKGHSGFAARGADIVCSAASALILTSVIAVSEIAEIRQIIDQRDGYLKSIISLRDVKQKKIDTLEIIINTMIIGLREIINNHPDSIEINFK